MRSIVPAFVVAVHVLGLGVARAAGCRHTRRSRAAGLGSSVEPMAKSKADYAKYSRGAWKGLNEPMLAAHAGLVLVFHPAIDASRGSKHLVELAQAAGVEVRVFAG